MHWQSLIVFGCLILRGVFQIISPCSLQCAPFFEFLSRLAVPKSGVQSHFQLDRIIFQLWSLLASLTLGSFILGCIQAAFKLHQSCAQAAFKLLPSCIHQACIQSAYRLLSSCFQVAFRLHSSCTQAAFRLHSGCIQAAFKLHSGCTQTLWARPPNPSPPIR